MTGDDRSVLRDPELVDLLADEPELLAILDAYATTQVEEAYSTAPSSTWRRAFAGRRRGPILAAGLGAAALASALALLPMQLGERELGVVDQALAAVSTGPVLHAVLEVPVSDVTHAPGPVSFTTVDLASGEERQVTATIELWYDPNRQLVRLLQRGGGAVTWELLETPAGVQDGRGGRESAPPPTVDAALAAFFKGYKQALADGTAVVVGSETIDGRRAQWLRFPPRNASGLPREIAVDTATYEPLLLRAVCPECSNAPPTYRVLALEGVSESRADFTPPTPRSRDVTTYAGSRSVVSAAEARTLLGGDALWSGSAVGGKRLASIHLLQLSSHSDTPPSHANVIDRGVALQFVYGERSSLGASAGTAGETVTISESADYEFVFSGFNFNNREAGQPLTLAGGAIPPEGEVALSSTRAGHWTAQLRANGLYVEIGGPSRALVLDAARALKRIDG